MDIQLCLSRNIHKREENDVENCIKYWTQTPESFLKVDPRPFLQSIAIPDVEMEDVQNDEVSK